MSQYPQGDPVEEARLLLPWYITGKLTEPESRLVEKMLEQHPELHEEYQRELRLVDMIRANTGLLHLTAVDTTQQRLDRLMKRIGRDEQEKNPSPDNSVKKTSSKGITHGWWQFFRSLLPQAGWLTPASAVFALLLLVQAGFLGWFAYQAGNSPDTVYISADVTDSKASIPVTSGMVLLIGFNGNAQVQQMQAFLAKWNARIVDGPDDNNLFTIEIRTPPPVGSSADQHSDLILQEMQQDQAMVDFVGRKF